LTTDVAYSRQWRTTFGEVEPAQTATEVAFLPLPAYGMVLDVPQQGEVLNRGVRERKTVQDGRLVTELFYADGTADRFEWQLFTPAELAVAAARHDLVEVLACAGFDETLPPSPGAPRMQLVFAPG
jgi:hypothetical protein